MPNNTMLVAALLFSADNLPTISIIPEQGPIIIDHWIHFVMEIIIRISSEKGSENVKIMSSVVYRRKNKKAPAPLHKALDRRVVQLSKGDSM